MATGITVDEQLIKEYLAFKLSSSVKRFMIMKIDDETGKRIVVEHISESNDFNQFLSHLPEREPRYAVLKHSFKTLDGRDAEKLINVTW